MGINGVSSYANTYTYGNVKNENVKATARKCLAAENDCANISTWTKILKGIKIYYGDNYGATQENNAYKVDDLGGYCMFA